MKREGNNDAIAKIMFLFGNSIYDSEIIKIIWGHQPLIVW